jgi:hypothetical protein
MEWERKSVRYPDKTIHEMWYITNGSKRIYVKWNTGLKQWDYYTSLDEKPIPPPHQDYNYYASLLL